MSCRAQKEWSSFFTKEIEQIWHEEREEMKSISMLYCALQNEINRIQNVLSHEVSQIKSDIKQRDFLKKCRSFEGLAQSERFMDGIDFDKENETPSRILNLEPPLFSSPSKSEELVIETPNTSDFFNPLQSVQTSPILKKNSLKKKPSGLLDTPSKFCRSPLKCTPKNIILQPTLCDDSNILESSIIDDTPDVKKPLKRNKFSLLQTRKRKKSKSNHNHTLTEMFLAPTKEKEINIKESSLGITDIIKLINESSSETDAGILSDDATVAGLDVSGNNKVNPYLKSFAEQFNRFPEKVIESPMANVVRGKARKKLLGWSCRDCEQYYKGLNLPPDELEKKKNECSRHRHKLKPKEDTFDGFWDLTFGPTPQTPK